MFPSAVLSLLTLLRRIRSIGHTLKSLILRFLLSWPSVLRNLRRILSVCSRTNNPEDKPKKEGGQARPSFPGASGVCEGYSTIYASRDFNRAGEPHLPSLGPSNADALPLRPILGQSRSMPHSPASSLAPSLPGSPQRSDRRLSTGSTPSLASSRSADSIHGRQLTIRHLNTPLTLTHSRVTSTQFSGAPPSRSWSPSPLPLPFPLPFSFSSPSPSPSLHRHPLPQSTTQESSGSTQIPILRDTSERSRRSSFDIRVSPPSRSQTLELNIQRPPQFPTAELDLSTENPSDPRGFGPPHPVLTHGNTHHSSGYRPAGAMAPSSDQAQYLPHTTSQQSVVVIPVADASRIWSDGKTRSIRLMHSEQVSRYVNKGAVPPVHSKYRLRPMEVDLPQYSFAKCPEGWAPATHPGGALYFYNTKRRIFTDVYMYDSNLSAEIHEFAAQLDDKRTQLLLTNDLPIDHYDLVLDIIKTENNETIWAYYYVDHNTKTLFWLHPYECGVSVLREVRGVQEASHVKLRLESLYWVHWSLYPIGPEWRRFPQDAPNELLGALLSGGIDSLTSKVSTSPYTVAEMESMRDFIKEAESLGTRNPHVITSVARLLSFYAHWRFLHFHGQKAPRQDRYKSIYKGSRRKRTILIRVLSPMLFFFPDVHLLELENVWTDKIVVEALWKEFMQKLVSEWTEFVLYSTVMLAANVAFLAIPGVIVAPQYPVPPNAWIKPSPAQIASSISLVFSIGSIITGLLLIRRNRTMMTKDPKSAWNYLHGMKWPVVGLEPLAIVFSLTYALLMWSAWVFFVALLTFSFQGTSKRIWIPVGIAAGVVTVFIFWCIANTWDPEEQEEEPIELPYEPEPQLTGRNNTQA